MRSGRFSWIGWTALLGVVAAIALIAVGTGGLGLLLLIPLALVFDVGLLKGIKSVAKRIIGKKHA